MGNHRNNIKNEIAYFRKVIKNMEIKESIKLSKVNENKVLTNIIQDITFAGCGQNCGQKEYFNFLKISLIQSNGFQPYAYCGQIFLKIKNRIKLKP